ncbi:hypothetical protein TSAR_011689 [Trichomalopsis sarcophagae]|uniref:Uncharacterized protein n=1 Tax=Trichomalopsis sarcophagae TaxID=543379 RepID=A0A232EKN6_9HYME|nr:hypothetical protein TSAR_011689 [Trichomalopsis sarcophagae]
MTTYMGKPGLGKARLKIHGCTCRECIVHFVVKLKNSRFGQTIAIGFSEIHMSVNFKMSSLRLFTVCFVFLNFGLETRATESSNFTQEWTTDFYYSNKPVIVKVENDVLVVSLNSNSTIHLTSVDDIVINTCKFSVPRFRTVEPLQKAVVLGNGKVVALTVMAPNFVDGQGAWDLYVIVDPYDCSSTKIPYHDSFDLFYSKSMDLDDRPMKSPRRFSDTAEPINLDHHFGLEAEVYYFHIETVKPYNASEGYVCKMIYEDGKKTSLWRLDSEFKLINEISVEPWVNAMSAAHYSVSLCYRRADHLIPIIMKRRHSYSSQDIDDLFGGSPRKLAVSCDRFDIKELNHRASVKLYKPESVYVDTAVDAVNLPDGSTVVALGFQYPSSIFEKAYTKEYNLQRINVDGSLNEAIHVFNYAYSFDMMSVLPLSGGEICLVVVGGWFEPFLSSRANGKCFNMLT